MFEVLYLLICLYYKKLHYRKHSSDTLRAPTHRPSTHHPVDTSTGNSLSTGHFVGRHLVQLSYFYEPNKYMLNITHFLIVYKKSALNPCVELYYYYKATKWYRYHRGKKFVTYFLLINLVVNCQNLIYLFFWNATRTFKIYSGL